MPTVGALGAPGVKGWVKLGFIGYVERGYSKCSGFWGLREVHSQQPELTHYFAASSSVLCRLEMRLYLLWVVLACATRNRLYFRRVASRETACKSSTLVLQAWKTTLFISGCGWLCELCLMAAGGDIPWYCQCGSWIAFSRGPCSGEAERVGVRVWPVICFPWNKSF